MAIGVKCHAISCVLRGAWAPLMFVVFVRNVTYMPNLNEPVFRTLYVCNPTR